jgi:hypoxanthine phosphoribosyltransferase
MQIQVNNKDFFLYINQQQIQQNIQRIANQINSDYADKKPLVIGVLNGAFMFTSDLVKYLTCNCEITFMRVSSYLGTQSSGTLQQVISLKESLKDRDVIVVEDIIDTGLTMNKLLTEIEKEGVLSVKVVTLLFKKEALKVPIKPDYVGFEIPQKFVVGYGLDFDGYGRNYPDIYAETV